MTFETINLRVEESVAVLTLSRPTRANALNGRMLEEINVAMDRCEQSDGIKAVIVTGAGAAFSSGFDLKEQMEQKPTGFDQWRTVLRKDFNAIMRFPDYAP